MGPSTAIFPPLLPTLLPPFHPSRPLFSPPYTPFPSPSLRSRLSLIQLWGLRERCKLPQRVWAEPGRQTLFGAFWVNNASAKINFKSIHENSPKNLTKRLIFFSYQRGPGERLHTPLVIFYRNSHWNTNTDIKGKGKHRFV